MGTGTVVRDIELLSRVIEGPDEPMWVPTFSLSLLHADSQYLSFCSNFAGWSYGTVVAEYLSV